MNSYSLCTCYSLLALGELSVHVTVSWLSVNRVCRKPLCKPALCKPCFCRVVLQSRFGELIAVSAISSFSVSAVSAILSFSFCHLLSFFNLHLERTCIKQTVPTLRVSVQTPQDRGASLYRHHKTEGHQYRHHKEVTLDASVQTPQGSHFRRISTDATRKSL